MPVVDTTQSFATGDTVTSTTLNNIMDQSIFVAGAVVSGSGLAITAGGQMTTSNIPGANITSGTITGGVGGSIANDTITDLNVNSSAGISGSKLADNSTSGAKITDASITAPKLSGAQTGAAPIYGARAWVSFDGTTAGTFAGGGSTVTRVAGSTLCTVTTTSPHGMVTNNRVYASTGVAAGTYTITRLTDTAFTFNTAATTALNSVSITFLVRSIYGAGNVNSVSFSGTGFYYVNMSTQLNSSNYAVSWAGTSNGVSGTTFTSTLYLQDKTNSSFGCQFSGATAANNQNQPIVDFVVFQ